MTYEVLEVGVMINYLSGKVEDFLGAHVYQLNEAV
jgi:hypothetical protein